MYSPINIRFNLLFECYAQIIFEIFRGYYTLNLTFSVNHIPEECSLNLPGENLKPSSVNTVRTVAHLMECCNIYGGTLLFVWILKLP